MLSLLEIEGPQYVMPMALWRPVMSRLEAIRAIVTSPGPASAVGPGR